MKTYRLIAGIGLAFLLTSSFLPLLKIYTLVGEKEITLF